jgi:virulence-associated protein VapD
MAKTKKAEWIIAYDLNVKKMRESGYSKSQVTQYYSTIREILFRSGFEKFTQQSLYCSGSPDAIAKAYQVIIEIMRIKDPQYVNRLHLFEATNLTDLRSFLPNSEAVEIDPIKILIEETYELHNLP